jgi:hypothetical protein
MNQRQNDMHTTVKHDLEHGEMKDLLIEIVTYYVGNDDPQEWPTGIREAKEWLDSHGY